MEAANYKKLSHDNVTTTYKKADQRKINNINRDPKKIAIDLDLEDRIEKMQKSESYITVKDDKEDFPHKMSCRLINPSKSDISKISKHILDKINQQMRSETEVNQWKNSCEVIEWFKNIRNKSNASFFVFDIESFYPSISLKLLGNAINFSKSICNISEQDMLIIMQARRTLFNDGEPWVKKTDNEEFDVPMGCFDGAEICELVGIFNLNLLKSTIRKENVGLYCDDGLGVLQNLSGPKTERLRKRITKIVKDCRLNIIIKMNWKTVDFLDVRFDLVNNTYEPYRKPNNGPVYIHKQSNHPPNIIKELIKLINKRISDISCYDHVFNNPKETRKKALESSGFTKKLTCIRPNEQNQNNRET